jgi:hypothetical protein
MSTTFADTLDDFDDLDFRSDDQPPFSPLLEPLDIANDSPSLLERDALTSIATTRDLNPPLHPSRPPGHLDLIAILAVSVHFVRSPSSTTGSPVNRSTAIDPPPDPD